MEYPDITTTTAYYKLLRTGYEDGYTEPPCCPVCGDTYYYDSDVYTGSTTGEILGCCNCVRRECYTDYAARTEP